MRVALVVHFDLAGETFESEEIEVLIVDPYVFDAACFLYMPALDRSLSDCVYTCRRLIDLSLIAGTSSVRVLMAWRSFASCWRCDFKRRIVISYIEKSWFPNQESLHLNVKSGNLHPAPLEGHAHEVHGIQAIGHAHEGIHGIQAIEGLYRLHDEMFMVCIS